ncbi:uncharacterized protein K452DRAFT_359484 [Aplosporella prunicola CBS 121167]|uniref:Uncharacterized protein n=1 Tax=Aplosporella prunicola CBS 121167 TaxID=1176127 RepID=A0A6A6BAJ5_9PEZI|nr:uncharacterized protein K452DRAFT_359484 [Aplosporella prunicola CBS 121167]KAF2141110.1 hypothetical protein K452DRAFT_359484 [Aplosporella prunicola CBS 121167]
MNEQQNIPPVSEDDRTIFREWLDRVKFPGAKHPGIWENSRSNWASFLSATSRAPQEALAPRCKVEGEWGRARGWEEQPETKAESAKRFGTDERRRRRIRKQLWELLDGLEALAERWPCKARVVLNRAATRK